MTGWIRTRRIRNNRKWSRNNRRKVRFFIKFAIMTPFSTIKAKITTTINIRIIRKTVKIVTDRITNNTTRITVTIKANIVIMDV